MIFEGSSAHFEGFGGLLGNLIEAFGSCLGSLHANLKAPSDPCKSLHNCAMIFQGSFPHFESFGGLLEIELKPSEAF